MGQRSIRQIIEPQWVGQRLDQVVAELLCRELAESISKGKARGLIVAGAVYLNRKRVRIASKTLREGAHLEVIFDPRKLKQPSALIPIQFEKLSREQILFEDADFILVNKPQGLPTQPTLDEARVNLYSLVKKWVRESEGCAQPYVGLHHRLDRDTSGVVLFTKSKRVNRSISEQFQNHTLVKKYWALVPKKDLKVGDEWSMRQPLGPTRKLPSGVQLYGYKKDGKPAETQARCIKVYAQVALLELTPLTGRTHQIRAHLFEAGFPIVGDPWYQVEEPKEKENGALALHACSLTFFHPIKESNMTIEAPAPAQFMLD